MSYACSQCGAIFNGDEKCADRFALILSKEFESPEYGVVHHLSVPCYYLQHNLYSKEGWLSVRKLVKQFINKELTPETARREINANFNGNKKEFSMTKGAKLAEADDIKWSFTIANVRFETSAAYCCDILNWAESIVRDSEKLIYSQHHNSALKGLFI